MLKIKHLSYHKGFKSILKDINLTIYDKSFNIIIGENGCGKSTLLKIITKAILKGGIKSNFLNVFYLADKFHLPGNKYVIDFLYEAIDIFKDSIELSKYIKDFEIPNKKIKNLSKGNYKKVAIIYSLLTKADLLIYDEILDGIDPEIVKKVVKLLKNLDKTIIVVTHFIKAFRYINYNLIEMRDGKIVKFIKA